MSSFYGNGGGTEGVSPRQVDTKVETGVQEAKNHIIFSKTQPTVQKTGDIWMVIVSQD